MIQKITLLELNKSIQEKIKSSFPETIWVIAEISELKINRNGHCYIELIEKDAINDNIIAKTRATIWAFTFRMLKPYFESTTGHELTLGLKILVQASIEFHELYGFSLNITDIDPNYTIGDLAQKRSEIIKKLEDDGVIDMNKEIQLPIVPQKIAIISSETAAGYQDFINQLNSNSFEHKFYIKLFPSIMQGIQAEESIIESLEKIYNYEDFFDVVVIIRGGGSQADLNCFNSYILASNVAQFPIPIITGIGHDKDESVVDIVAHKKLKTPTAVAEFIIETVNEFENKLFLLKDEIFDYLQDFLNNENTRIIQLSSLAIPSIKNSINKNKYHLSILSEQLKNNYRKTIQSETIQLSDFSNQLKNKTERIISKKKDGIVFVKNQFKSNNRLIFQKLNLSLENISNKIELLNPENILKRGYSITYKNGKRIKDFNKIQENDEIITQLFSGFIRSNIRKKSKKIKDIQNN